jgi:hypothetical protein
LSRGWLAGDVVEVRRSSDSTSQDFTASQITNGQMLSWVNHDTTGLYNSARYFNGVNTIVDLDSTITLADGEFFSFDIFYFSSQVSTATYPLTLGTSSTEGMVILSNNRLRFRINGETMTTVASIVDDQFNSIHILRSGNDLIVTINGAEETLSFTSGAWTFSRLGGRSAQYAVALFRNINYNDVSLWAGSGTSVTAWEDTIGSNDGTETSGAAYTGQPFDGFVSTWYDQSGNANDATQIATASQPKIVDAGALVTGGIDFDGVDDGFEIDFGADLTQASSLFMVHQSDTTTDSLNEFFDSAGLASPRTLLDQSGTDYRLLSSNSVGTGVALTTDQSLVFALYNGASSFFAKNGTATGALNAGSVAINQNSTLGSSDVRFYDGKMDEFIIYNSDQSANRVAIETNINSHYDIY